MDKPISENAFYNLSSDNDGCSIEANFDGLVGPTHNYAGLSFGNKASTGNAGLSSNPQLAALQGLKKMKTLSDLGFIQGVVAPHDRPNIIALRQLGFTGSDADVLSRAAKKAPAILAACCSASSMWTANAATVSPSADCIDYKIHFTPANLVSYFHRSLEPKFTSLILQSIFNSPDHFIHHSPLPSITSFGDEGAANHMRFCDEYNELGVELFVYGKRAFKKNEITAQIFPARQTLEASEAIARNHKLNSHKTLFVQQQPHVIDQGVFHNDVIAVSNRNVLFCHEQAFVNQKYVYEQLKTAFNSQPLHIIEVPEKEVTIQESISSYLFNSQLLSLRNNQMLLVVPSECEKTPAVWGYLQKLTEKENSKIISIKSFDLRQSMKNGGGPACLRLRVVLNQDELKYVNKKCLIDNHQYTTLTRWVKKHYRTQLSEEDLADPKLLIECHTALDELTKILNIGNIYSFQK